jgi:hypothetical protein
LNVMRLIWHAGQLNTERRLNAVAQGTEPYR